MYTLRAGQCARKRKKVMRLTRHEAREDMKEKKKKECVKRGKDEKGSQMEGAGTDEAKPHYNDLGKPAPFECTRCMCAQGLDRFQ